MFNLVSMFKVVDFGIVTVGHTSTAFRKLGASSAPLAVKMHEIFGGFPGGNFGFDKEPKDSAPATDGRIRPNDANTKKLKRIIGGCQSRHRTCTSAFILKEMRRAVRRPSFFLALTRVAHPAVR